MEVVTVADDDDDESDDEDDDESDDAPFGGFLSAEVDIQSDEDGAPSVENLASFGAALALPLVVAGRNDVN